jgi:VWFA-related protein
VWEDNKEQTIKSFAFETAPGETASGETASGETASGETASGDSSAPATPQTSYLVLAFDYAGMAAGDQLRARQEAARFIDANAGPDHLMAVADFYGGFRIVQGFTGNAGRLKDVVNGPRSSVTSANNAAAGTSASADLGSRDMFRSLQRLASDLGSVPGRKTIVLLTGSLTVGSSQQRAMTEAIAACSKSNVVVYPIDVRDASPQGAFSAENASAARGGRGGGGRGRGPAGDADPGASLDPGGVSQQVLFALANGTGGFVIRNAGELPAGLQKIGQEQREYYVLSYTPPESKEGTCHNLRVRVDRSGTTVRARSSYCTGKTRDLVTGSAAEKDLVNRAAAAQAGNIDASMQLPFFYVGPNTARVHVAMNIAPDAVKFERKKGVSHAEVNVLGIASTSQGEDEGATGARFNDTVTLDLDDAELQKWKEKPLHYEKEFKIAPGQYKFTVVFNSGGESFGRLEQPLRIDPYQAGQLALSAVAFGKEVHNAGDAGAALFIDRTPLVTGGLELTIAGSNVFTKAEQAFCYFEVYTPDPANPGTAGVRVVDAKTDELKWDGGAIKLGPLSGGKSTIPVGLNLPIASFAPGSYRLEITAAAGADKSVRRTGDFEVK